MTPCRVKQVPDQRISQGVTDGRAQLSGGDDIPHSKNGQLLRNERLIELTRQLQFANTSVSSAEELEMRGRTGRPRARKSSALRASRSASDRHITSDILLYYCLCMSTHERRERARDPNGGRRLFDTVKRVEPLGTNGELLMTSRNSRRSRRLPLGGASDPRATPRAYRSASRRSPCASTAQRLDSQRPTTDGARWVIWLRHQDASPAR